MEYLPLEKINQCTKEETTTYQVNDIIMCYNCWKEVFESLKMMKKLNIYEISIEFIEND